jgi:hypothetical protein
MTPLGESCCYALYLRKFVYKYTIQIFPHAVGSLVIDNTDFNFCVCLHFVNMIHDLFTFTLFTNKVV